MVEGEKSVVELIHSNFIIDSIYATSDWINEHQCDITEDIPNIVEAGKTDLERMSYFQVGIASHSGGQSSDATQTLFWKVLGPYAWTI